MKKLRVRGTIGIIRPVREKNIRINTDDNGYLVDERGLVSRDYRKFANGNPQIAAPGVKFRITTCKYGGDSGADFHPSIRLFIEKLKGLGAHPEYEENEDESNFAFWFDVSSKRNPAYYWLGTGNHGQEIFPFVHADSIDGGIIANVVLLDKQLGDLLIECGVQTYS